MTSVALRAARSQDMAACAAILNDWIDSTAWVPRVHPPTDVLRHYQTEVAASRRTVVAVVDGAIAGFVSHDADGFVTALYVAHDFRRRGIGGRLLDRVKSEMDGSIRLWTFQENAGAQKFYIKHGFVESNRTSGDNEENLPDILLEWQA